MLLAVSVIWLAASAQSPESLPNPNVGHPDNYIADPAGQLSPQAKREVNSRLDALRKRTTCEVGVAVVNSLEGMTIEDYSYELFRHWGLGKKDNNNGVLLVISPAGKAARIEVGSGAEGVLTDISCANIIRNKVVPAMKKGNVDKAVAGAVEDIYGAMTDPAVAGELRSAQGEAGLSRIKTLDKDVLWNFLVLVAGCVFLFTLVLFIYDFSSTRRRDNYRRAMTWRNHLRTYWWGSLLSLGTALPFAILAYLLYRHARDVTEICDTCGGKMKKLSEKDDNAYLSPSQDFEERIGTVNYDVWLCPKCGTVERFPYVERQLKYQECPECHTIAMNLVMDKVVDPPTTKSEGHGERLYQCQFCRHTKRENYRIPRKADDSAVLAAAVLGSAIGRGGHGGGGGGSIGGFGGGHSSGGGASGHW